MPPPRAHRWLIVSAWPPELARLRARLRALPARVRAQVALARVGVGLVEAGVGTSNLLAKRRPAALLLVGTAGVYPGHARHLPVGAAAVVDQMSLLPEPSPSGAGLLPPAMATRRHSSLALTRALLGATGLPAVDLACPLAITVGARAAAAAAKRSGAALENLEAFAVATAAATAGVPFAAVLGIANRVGPAGHREWQRHGPSAAAAACDAVLALLSGLAARKPQGMK